MNSGKIEIVDYDLDWPKWFIEESQRIQEAVDGQLAAIYHIGSTAIPNMAAKPIIDILIELKNLDNVDEVANELYTLGYAKLHRQIIPYRSFITFRNERGERKVNLHIYEVGDPQVKRHVNFRDYLIAHPEEAAAYADLKKSLAQQFKYDIVQYVTGKEKLVHKIGAKAKLWAHQTKSTTFSPQNRGLPASHWARDKILQAMEANLNVHMTYFSQFLEPVELIRVPGWTLVNSGLSDDTFNYVLDTHLEKTKINEKIQEIIQKFATKPFSWWVSPNDAPADLDQYLEQAGLENAESNVGMYLNLDAWMPSNFKPRGLEIVRALDEKTLQDFASVLANDEESFQKYFSWIASVITDDDPLEFYVGYVNGKPVTRGYMIFYAGVAGLHMLSTTPDERKKGYGTAMQEFRLKRAKDLGYHIAVLQASTQGLPLYRQLGYKEFGVFKEFKPTRL